MAEMSPPSEKQDDLKAGLDDPAREARRRRMEIRRLKVIAHAGTPSERRSKRSRSVVLAAAPSDNTSVPYSGSSGDVNTTHLPWSPESGFVADTGSPVKNFAEEKDVSGSDFMDISVSDPDNNKSSNDMVESLPSSSASVQKTLPTMMMHSGLAIDNVRHDDGNTAPPSVMEPKTTLVSVASTSSGVGLVGNYNGGFGLVGETSGFVDFAGKSGFVSENHFLPWGYASICGRRSEMEDTFAAVPGFLSVASEIVGESHNSNQNSALHFFGVYDGHGGAQAANFCKTRLHQALTEELEVVMNGEDSSSGGNGGEKNWQWKWEKALVACFNKVDAEVGGEAFRTKGYEEEVSQEVLSEPAVPETVGSTAVVAVVGSSQIIVANCGDSRVVLSRSGKAIALSVDQKPERDDEMARIEAAGGRVIHWNGYRVFGVLAMSRAIGDRYLKPCIISDPEVTFTKRTDEDECLILASDGLWDVLSNEEVCEIARRRLAREHNRNSSSSSKARNEEMDPSVQAVADYLSKMALQRGSSDNITVVVVDLLAKRNA
eukprot:Gb_07154 [translate_table: standard]